VRDCAWPAFQRSSEVPCLTALELLSAEVVSWPVLRGHSPVTESVPDESISRMPQTEPSGILTDPLLPLNFTNFGWPVLLPLRPFAMQLKVTPRLHKPNSSLRNRDELLPLQPSLHFRVSHLEPGADDVERIVG